METDFPQMMACQAVPEPPAAADPTASPQQRFPRLWLLLTRDPDTVEGAAARIMLASMYHEGLHVNLWQVWRELGQLALEDMCALLRIPQGLYRDRALRDLLEQSGELIRLRQVQREAEAANHARRLEAELGTANNVFRNWRPSKS